MLFTIVKYLNSRAAIVECEVTQTYFMLDLSAAELPLKVGKGWFLAVNDREELNFIRTQPTIECVAVDNTYYHNSMVALTQQLLKMEAYYNTTTAKEGLPQSHSHQGLDERIASAVSDAGKNGSNYPYSQYFSHGGQACRVTREPRAKRCGLYINNKLVREFDL